MITKSFAFEKQQGLHHNKVNLSLTPVKRLGNQAPNCKLDYFDHCNWKEKNKFLHYFLSKQTFPPPPLTAFSMTGYLDWKKKSWRIWTQGNNSQEPHLIEDKKHLPYFLCLLSQSLIWLVITMVTFDDWHSSITHDGLWCTAIKNARYQTKIAGNNLQFK